VHTARIMTIGERAEDIFCCSDADGQPLTEQQCESLRVRINEKLDKSA